MPSTQKTRPKKVGKTEYSIVTLVYLAAGGFIGWFLGIMLHDIGVFGLGTVTETVAQATTAFIIIIVIYALRDANKARKVRQTPRQPRENNKRAPR